MTMRVLSILAACALVAACSASADDATPELREGTVRVQSRESSPVDVSTTEPIKLGKNELVVTFPSRPGTELVQASALMPAHGHGSKPPTVERDGDAFRVSNLVLYMSGRWEVRFALRVDGQDDEALVTVDVP
jgi:outer membrane biogenesis lipoprotein LolB